MTSLRRSVWTMSERCRRHVGHGLELPNHLRMTCARPPPTTPKHVTLSGSQIGLKRAVSPRIPLVRACTGGRPWGSSGGGLGGGFGRRRGGAHDDVAGAASPKRGRSSAGLEHRPERVLKTSLCIAGRTASASAGCHLALRNDVVTELFRSSKSSLSELQNHLRNDVRNDVRDVANSTSRWGVAGGRGVVLKTSLCIADWWVGGRARWGVTGTSGRPFRRWLATSSRRRRAHLLAKCQNTTFGSFRTKWSKWPESPKGSTNVDLRHGGPPTKGGSRRGGSATRGPS